jgi:hypothetical protein
MRRKEKFPNVGPKLSAHTNGVYWYENPKKPDVMWVRHKARQGR